MRRLGAHTITVNGVTVHFAEGAKTLSLVDHHRHDEEEYDAFMDVPKSEASLREPVYPFDNWLNQKVAPNVGGR